MRVDVLGSVQDGGVPHLGCGCVVCDRARHDPRERRYVAAILVESGGNRYLVDPTPDLPLQLADPPDAVFLTHAHLGHLPGLLQFGPEAAATTSLPVHCTESMAAFLRRNQPFAHLVDAGHVDLVAAPPGSAVDLPDGRVVSRAEHHRTEVGVDTVSYRIEGPEQTLYYATDLDEWREDALAQVETADVAVLDGTFWETDDVDRYDDVPHPPMTETMRRTEGFDTDCHFTHLNHSNPVLRPDSTEARELERAGYAVVERGDHFVL